MNKSRSNYTTEFLNQLFHVIQLHFPKRLSLTKCLNFSCSIPFTASVPVHYLVVIELLGCQVESLRQPHIPPLLCPKVPGTPGLFPSSDKLWLFVRHWLCKVVLAGRAAEESVMAA